MNRPERRRRFLEGLSTPVVLFAGQPQPRNYPANVYPFRADSTFQYFFDTPEPGSAALFDPADGRVTLFLPQRTLDDALWDGEKESFEAARARHQVHDVIAVEQLETTVAADAKGRQVRSVAVADWKTTARARALTGEALSFDEPSRAAAPELIDLLARLRLRKSHDELAALRALVPVSREAHLAAMRHSAPGVTEQHLVGHVEGTFARNGCVPAYGTILTVRGEVLHNHAHGNTLAAGDIVLLDAGPESEATGYCNDVTRAWPVGGPFSPEGRDVYRLVLAAEQAAIAAVKPGARYRDIHLLACRVVAQGLKDMGLLKGQVDDLVERGAHAVFFPHGVGHHLGLDVHDLETYGDRVHYPGGRTRSTQFGTAFLRMDMDLEPGMTFTIEPGVYFVPAILRSPELTERFRGDVDWARAERFLSMNGGRGFGGIRIEDDVACTASGVEVLTHDIPRELEEIEALAGAAA